MKKKGGMKMTYETNKYYIVRANGAGVFHAKIKEVDGSTFRLNDARRLWYWAGASSLSQLAQEGTQSPSACKFPCQADEVTVFNVIEVLACTDKANASLRGVPVWKK